MGIFTGGEGVNYEEISGPDQKPPTIARNPAGSKNYDDGDQHTRHFPLGQEDLVLKLAEILQGTRLKDCVFSFPLKINRNPFKIRSKSPIKLRAGRSRERESSPAWRAESPFSEQVGSYLEF